MFLMRRSCRYFNYYGHILRHSSSQTRTNHLKSEKVFPKSGFILIGAGLSLTLGGIAYAKSTKDYKDRIEDPSDDGWLPKYRPDLKDYRIADVGKHNSPENGIWIIFGDGVYDITKFVNQHPGGDKILLGAGGDIAPFWNLYAVHKSPEVYKILEQYRIGNLHPDDKIEYVKPEKTDDPYYDDPVRSKIFDVRSMKPFNAEPPLHLLTEKFYTPNEVFYIRNHLPVPQIDPDDYALEVEGHGLKNKCQLSLKELKEKFPRKSINVTVQCAGNRRSEMDKKKPVKGLYWGSAAIGNAQWTGALLLDVLKYCDADLNDHRIKHLVSEGIDTDGEGKPYGASTSADIALDPKSQFLLAYEMNGEELSRDHGYPVRLIAPGIVGARNTKWLGKIILSDKESDSHWQHNDYKGFSPNVDWNNVDFEKAVAIQQLPVQSAICDPVGGERVKPDSDGNVTARGYAWSGGGRKIVRVDVSTDGGKNWIVADLEQDDSPLNQCWSWTLWKVKIPIPKNTKGGTEIDVICKAIDSHYNVQPDTVEPIWNLRGVLTNSWHRISFKIV